MNPPKANSHRQVTMEANDMSLISVILNNLMVDIKYRNAFERNSCLCLFGTQIEARKMRG